jgi:hypothetical protein
MMWMEAGGIVGRGAGGACLEDFVPGANKARGSSKDRHPDGLTRIEART